MNSVVNILEYPPRLPVGDVAGTIKIKPEIVKQLDHLSQSPTIRDRDLPTSMNGSPEIRQVADIGANLGQFLLFNVGSVRGADRPDRAAEAGVYALAQSAGLSEKVLNILADNAFLVINQQIINERRSAAA